MNPVEYIGISCRAHIYKYENTKVVCSKNLRVRGKFLVIVGPRNLLGIVEEYTPGSGEVAFGF